MIDDELRGLLAERAGALPDNPARVTQVHNRIRTVRRRRTAGTALVVVLIAVAGVVLTRLPGRPDALPTGAPAGPYFEDDGRSASVDGYRGGSYFSFDGDATWSATARFDRLEYVVVARCERRGGLTLRNRAGTGPELRLSCTVPVGEHYEGALPVDPAQAGELFPENPPGAGAGVELRPGSAGSWAVGLLEPLFPDRLAAADIGGALLTGFGSPAGGRLTVTVPGAVETAKALAITVACVRGVRLEFLVAGHPLGVAICDDAHAQVFGAVQLVVREPVLGQAGVRALDRVTVEVRSTGRQTGEWAVVAVG